MPTPNVKAQAALRQAQSDADRADFVEWPVNIHGQESQGF